MDMHLSVTGNSCDVTLRGTFTFDDNREFRQVLNQIADPGIGQVVLHMAQVEFIDSAALGMLLLAHDETKKFNKTLIIKGINGQVKKIFEMARFEQFFTLQ